MQTDDGLSEIMTVRDVAKYLRVHHSTIYRLIRQVGFPAFKVGADWRVKRIDAEHWLYNRTRELADSDARKGGPGCD